MVSSASHSRFASHALSPRTLHAASAQSGDQDPVLIQATAPDGSRPPLSRPAARLRPALLLALASRSLLPHALAGDNGNSAPRLDASAAKSTSAISPLCCARPARPTARTGAEFPHSLAGPQSAVGFETSQTALSVPILQPLFWRRFGTFFFPYDTQKRLSPHRQGNVPIPARKRAHFVVVQADLAFGTLNTFLNRPAHAGHPHLLGQP